MRIGASTLPVFKKDLIEAIQELSALGFNLIEVMCEPPQALPRDLLSSNKLDTLKEMITQQGIEILLHAPIGDINLMAPNPGIRLEAQRQLKETLQLAHELNSKSVVFHIGGKPYMGIYDREKAYKDCLVALDDVLNTADKLGVEMLLENDPNKSGLGAITVEACHTILSTFKDRLGFILDIGHAHTLGSEGNQAFISTFGPLIKEIHISDNHGQRDEHLEIGKGTINFVDTLAMLQTVSFHGEVVIEVKEVEDLIRSKQELQKIMGKLSNQTV